MPLPKSKSSTSSSSSSQQSASGRITRSKAQQMREELVGSSTDPVKESSPESEVLDVASLLETLRLCKAKFGEDRIKSLLRGFIAEDVEAGGQSREAVREHLYQDKGFSAPYINDEYDCADFFRSLRGIVDEATSFPPGIQMEPQSAEFYAPYTALLQSSSCGKSRFLTQAKEDDGTIAITVYIGCKKDRSVFPDGSTCLTALLGELRVSSTKETLETMCQFLVRVVQKVLDKYFDGIVLTEELVNAIDLDELMEGQSRRYESEDAFNMALVSVAAKLEHLKHIDAEKRERRVIICAAFDEAAALLEVDVAVEGKSALLADPSIAPPAERVSAFRLVRRALGHLNTRHVCIPSYFASTQSSIGNLMPALERDTSRAFEYGLNETVNSKKYLHRPLLLHGTFDIYHRNPVDNDVVDLRGRNDWWSVLGEDVYFQNLLNYGRPIWKALKISKDLPTTMELLAMKVRTPQPFEKPIEYISDPDGFRHLKANRVFSTMVLGRTAFLGPLFHSQHFSEELVNSQMAYLHAFNEVAGTCVVGFPSEPLLSGPACVALTGHFSNIVMYFCGLVSLVNTIDIGEHGEFVARLILVYAVQKTKPVPEAFKQVRLQLAASRKETIDCFAPRSVASVLGMLSPLLVPLLSSLGPGVNGEDRVSFSHWNQVAHLGPAGMALLTKSKSAFEIFLRDGLRRNCAYIMPKGFPAVDFIIPVALKNGAKRMEQGEEGDVPLSGEEKETREQASKRRRTTSTTDARYLDANGRLRRVSLATPRQCGAILVQVKNAKETRFRAISESMAACWPDVPCLRLCLSLGVSDPQVVQSEGVLFVEGLEHLGFDDECKEALRMLLACYERTNRFKIADETFREYDLFSSL